MATSQEALLGPLKGLRVVEFAGLGPAPFACMLLADMGADVVLVDRPGGRALDPLQIVNRGRSVVQVDLKSRDGQERALELLDHADVLVEGFRPGVMERLGLSPEVVLARNSRLVYGRMTGWGQFGPWAQAAGHDINYIAITGALAAIGTAEQPVPPLNLVGDYGGGSLYLVVGLLAALHEARASGCGQVVDAAITDGVAHLMAHFIAQRQQGHFAEQRESNMLDGGAPWYAVYPTSDGGFLSVGAIEPQFFALLVDLLGLDPAWKAAQHDRARWPQLRHAIGQVLRSRSRRHWESVFGGTDACVAPVLTLSEAMASSHHTARASFQHVAGVPQPGLAPRFSRTGRVVPPGPAVAASFEDVQRRWTHRTGARVHQE